MFPIKTQRVGGAGVGADNYMESETFAGLSLLLKVLCNVEINGTACYNSTLLRHHQKM